MAKVIKSLTIVMNPDNINNSLNKAVIRYVVGVTDDQDMRKSKEVELELSGQNLTNAEALMALALSQAEDEEGI